MKYKYAVPAPRQVGGDDGYCYSVFVNGKTKVTGCTRREASEYRKQFEKEERDKHATTNHP